MEPFNNRITVTPLVGKDKDTIGFVTDVFGEASHHVVHLQDQVVRDQLIAAGWTPPGEMPRPPWMKPDQFFGDGQPEHAMDIMPDNFHGIAAAIHHAMEALSQHEDAGTDWSPLDPKCSRRLRQALMAAWVLEYPKEAEALGVKLPYPPPTTA
jgi:hypothetical protein